MSTYLSVQFQAHLEPWQALEMFAHGENERVQQIIYGCKQQPDIEVGKNREEKQAQVPPVFRSQPERRDDDILLPFLLIQREDTGPLFTPLPFVQLNKVPGEVDVLKLPATRVQESLHEEASAKQHQPEHIMRNALLDEAQAGIKIVRININNLRYADDTTYMAESKE